MAKIRDAPRPKTKKQIRSFMGLAGYYRDFIPNFAAVAAPLSNLTRKGQPNIVVWGKAQERAYQQSRPILRTSQSSAFQIPGNITFCGPTLRTTEMEQC